MRHVTLLLESSLRWSAARKVCRCDNSKRSSSRTGEFSAEAVYHESSLKTTSRRLTLNDYYAHLFLRIGCMEGPIQHERSSLTKEAMSNCTKECFHSIGHGINIWLLSHFTQKCIQQVIAYSFLINISHRLN